MATGLAAARANAAIDSTVALGSWIKLHTGDPGAAGTANPAGNTTRQQATFGAAANGSATTTAVTEWANVPTAEDYTHFSMWTASTAGTFLASGTITANPVAVGDTFRFAAGSLTLSVTPAS